jgi:hypothetical protein
VVARLGALSLPHLLRLLAFLCIHLAQLFPNPEDFSHSTEVWLRRIYQGLGLFLHALV